MASIGSAPSEMTFFSELARYGGFSAAARELGVTTAAVSKRLALLEERLGVQLLHRTTRRTSLTAEGEIYLTHARRILGEIDDMEQLVAQAVATPKGLLRVNATPGSGRSHVAPLISRFVKTFEDVQVQLQLSVDPPSLTDDAFDVCIRFGALTDARAIVRQIAPNRRLLCASPGYLKQHGVPKTPHDLARHQCIGIRQGDDAYGTWRLSMGKRVETVKVRGKLSTTDGEIAVNWALDGHGILMRAEWDIAKYIRSGRLVQVLEAYEAPPANVHLVYSQRLQMSARVRAFVDFAAGHFEKASTLAAGLVARW